MGLTHILPNPQPRFPNQWHEHLNPIKRPTLSYTSCSISQIPSPNSSSLSTTVKTHFNPPHFHTSRWGNHFTFLQVSVPKLSRNNGASSPDESNSSPISFVKNAHTIIKRKRNSAAVYLTGRMLEIMRKLRGHEAVAWYIYNTLKNSSMAMSNLIGPVEQMALANHPIKGFYFTVIGGPESLGITMISYAGKLRVTIRMEKGFIDSQTFSSYIENAFDMVFKDAIQNTPPSNS